MWNKEKARSGMMHSNLIISVVILHVCGLNAPVGRHRAVSVIKPNDRLLMKEMKYMIQKC